MTTPHPVDKLVGRRIREGRHLRNLTQGALAEQIHVKFQQVQKYETGANRVSASRLHEIATALQMPITYFFDETEPEFQMDREAATFLRSVTSLPPEKKAALLNVARSMAA